MWCAMESFVGGSQLKDEARSLYPWMKIRVAGRDRDGLVGRKTSGCPLGVCLGPGRVMVHELQQILGKRRTANEGESSSRFRENTEVSQNHAFWNRFLYVQDDLSEE